MPVIYCAFDMFAINQAIRVLNDDGTTTTVYAAATEVPTVIAEMCKERKIDHVHFYGNEQFLNPVIEETTTRYNLHYHCGNPLTIEVN